MLPIFIYLKKLTDCYKSVEEVRVCVKSTLFCIFLKAVVFRKILLLLLDVNLTAELSDFYYESSKNWL